MSRARLFVALFLFILPLAFAQQRYTITDIGNLGGQTGGKASAINPSGEVTGSSDAAEDGFQHVFAGRNPPASADALRLGWQELPFLIISYHP